MQRACRLIRGGFRHHVRPPGSSRESACGGEDQGVPAEYVYKLWMGHGITTIREPGCGNGIEWCASETKRSAANAITAPRIFPYVYESVIQELLCSTSRSIRRLRSISPRVT